MSVFEVVNPADESVVTTVEELEADAVDAAVARAQVAQRRWAALEPAQRAGLLRDFAAAVDAHVEELAELEVANAGHPIGQARWEAGNVRDVLTYYSAAPERLMGKQIPVAGGLDITFEEPMGVVGIITPWNFPMPILGWGLGPALAAGNAVLVKPAEWTPLTALRIAELGAEAGLPEGLFQVLPGKGSVVGEALVDHPDVRKIVFTGSTETGTRVMSRAAKHVKRVTLELGGKSANIVFADSDLEQAAATAPYGIFDNAGQDCCARSRILVERSVYDRFMELFEPAVAKVAVGDPRDPGTEMGPLVSRSHREKVASYVPDDAPVAFRGTAPGGPGWWFPPTVLTPKRDDAVVREEVFGPVVAVLPFDDEVDAIEVANDSAYGLSGSIWTRDLSPGGARLPRRRGRQPVGQLALVGALQHAVRGLQAVRHRPRARARRAAAVHGDQERLPRHREPGEAMTVTRVDLTQRLAGRVAVVTGGASGIGLASSRRLAAEGAHVVVADLDPATGKAAADEVGGSFVAVDVANEEQVDALFDGVAREHGRLDIAFNNAGISPPEDDLIEATSIEAWDRVQQVNLTSVFFSCRAALRHMAPQGRGSIINTASFVAVMGSATSQISYTASKGGVLAMSRELGVQYARQGVRVNALCPGPVNTPLLQELFAKDPERAARRLVHVPVGRFAEPEEIAAAVAFLASDDSSFVTASSFLVDGGIHAAYVTPL